MFQVKRIIICQISFSGIIGKQKLSTEVIMCRINMSLEKQGREIGRGNMTVRRAKVSAFVHVCV